MNARWYVGAVLSVVLLLGCNQAVDEESDEDGATASDQREFENPEQRRYAEFADQFAAAIAQKKYDEAWKLASTHLQSRMTADELGKSEQESYAKFGQPAKALLAYAVTTEREELGNPAEGADAIDKLSAARAVGDIPESVPVDIRRASVQIDILRDPKTIPDFDPKELEGADEDDAPRSYLTMVLVEENGKLGVAHYWHRWPDILD